MRKVLVLMAAATLAAWGQNNTPAGNQSSDHSTAYYYYTLAHMYADLAAQSGSREYITKAIDNYKLAIKADPQSSALSEELTEFYVQTGRFKDAQNDAEEALKQNPNDLSALHLLAKLYTGQIGDGPQNRVDEAMLKNAIDTYKKITALAPKDTESWLMLGRLQKVAQDSAESEKAYKKALELEPDNEDALTGLALVYSDEGDNKSAADLLQKLAEKNPSQRSLQALALAYEQMRQYGLAADALKRVLGLNPPNAADVKRSMALDLLYAERYAESLQNYQELVSEDAGDAQSYLRISQIYRQQHDFVKARQAADKALSIDKDNLEIRYNEVSLLQAEGKNQEAIQALKDILTSTAKRNYNRSERTSRVALLRQLAAMYRDLDQTDLAVDAFRQTIDLDPEQGPQAGAEIIETYRQGHQFTKAEQEADADLKKWSDNRALHVVHATLLADMGKNDAAAAEIKKLMDGKNDLETYLTLAQVYDKGRKWDDMSKALDSAEKLSDSNDEKERVWFMRGAMYERMKKIEPAEAQFKKVLAVEPNHAAALNYIGYMLADRNIRLQEALSYIQKALEEEPGNGAYLDSLGWVYFRLGRLPEAEENLRRAVDKTPLDPTVHDHYAETLMAESKVKEAIAQWEISLKQWDAGPPADLEPAEVAKVKSKLENAKVRLAKETPPKQK